MNYTLLDCTVLNNLCKRQFKNSDHKIYAFPPKLSGMKAKLE